MRTYLDVILHMFIESSDSANWLTTSKDIAELLISIIAIIGGAIGLSYLNKQREKRIDASFGYMAQLSIRIRSIKFIFEHKKNELLNELVAPNKKIPREEFPDSDYEEVCEVFKQRISQTIEFLMNVDNQMPVYEGWTAKLSLFIDFLESFSLVFSVNGYLWWEGSKEQIEESKNEFYEEHIKNMNYMLDDIFTYQKSMEHKITKDYKRQNFIVSSPK